MKTWTVWAPAMGQTRYRGVKLDAPTARAAARTWRARQDADKIPEEGMRVNVLEERYSTMQRPPSVVSVTVHPAPETQEHG